MKQKALMILALLCMVAQGAWAESPDTAKVAEMNRRFRILYEAGNDSAFYKFAHEFEDYLKRTGDWRDAGTLEKREREEPPSRFGHAGRHDQRPVPQVAAIRDR